MENQNNRIDEVLGMADTATNEMFNQEQPKMTNPDFVNEKNPLKKIKSRNDYQVNVREQQKKLQEKFDVTNVIYQRNNSINIPMTGLKAGVLHLNPMLPMIVEGMLEQHLLDIKSGLYFN